MMIFPVRTSSSPTIVFSTRYRTSADSVAYFCPTCSSSLRIRTTLGSAGWEEGCVAAWAEAGRAGVVVPPAGPCAKAQPQAIASANIAPSRSLVM
jgi:hypothetical protein